MYVNIQPAWRLILVFGFVLSGSVRAEEPACKGGPVKISVVSILATDKDTKIDEKLDCIAREVQKIDPKWTGFRVAKMTCKSVPVDGKEPFELTADQIATVTVERGAGDDKPVQIKISPPQLGDITYTCKCGKFLPIVTRFRTKDNELLILAVRVEPCKGGKEKAK